MPTPSDVNKPDYWEEIYQAGRAGWGSLLGNIGGMIGKLAIALVMISVFLLRAPAPF